MKVEIDNGQRVFQVVTSVGKQAFCNLEHLNDVIKQLETYEGYFKIYHFWNNKAQKVSKKLLQEMFEAHGIKQEFYYQNICGGALAVASKQPREPKQTINENRKRRTKHGRIF